MVESQLHHLPSGCLRGSSLTSVTTSIKWKWRIFSLYSCCFAFLSSAFCPLSLYSWHLTTFFFLRNPPIDILLTLLTLIEIPTCELEFCLLGLVPLEGVAPTWKERWRHYKVRNPREAERGIQSTGAKATSDGEVVLSSCPIPWASRRLLASSCPSNKRLH